MSSNIVAVDLGASDTRVSSIDNEIHELPNNLRQIGLAEKLNLEPWIQPIFKDTLISNLDVTIKREEGMTEYIDAERRCVWGDYASRTGSTERPDNASKKHQQPINYYNMLMSIGVELLLSPNSFVRQEDGTIDLQLFMDLPPIECRGKEQIFAENIQGTYTLTFNALRPQKVIRFRIAGVSCFAEALATLYSYFFDVTGRPIAEHLEERAKNLLCLDIGASTTDSAAMMGGRFIEKSGDTYPIGGNQIRDALLYEMQAEYNFTPTYQQAEYAISTGFIEIGSARTNVANVIKRAKEDFSLDMVSHMQGYFKRMRYSIASFSKLIVGGGGSLASKDKVNNIEVETTPPLSEYLTKRLKQSCPTIQVESVSGNPRHANIKGLLVQARMWLSKQK